MWKDLPEVWQTAFSKGWEAFKHGAVPIGAVITDENGKIIYTGRNHIGEVKGGNNRIAHAETDCLLQLDTEKYPKFKEYTLYACMEPCPMCMGTFVMAGLRTLRVAARDRYCGAVHYINDDPYVNGKNIDATFELGEKELVQLVLSSYYSLRINNGVRDKVVEQFVLDCPQAVAVAETFYRERVLDAYAERNADFGEVYDGIIEMNRESKGKV